MYCASNIPKKVSELMILFSDSLSTPEKKTHEPPLSSILLLTEFHTHFKMKSTMKFQNVFNIFRNDVVNKRNKITIRVYLNKNYCQWCI